MPHQIALSGPFLEGYIFLFEYRDFMLQFKQAFLVAFDRTILVRLFTANHLIRKVYQCKKGLLRLLLDDGDEFFLVGLHLVHLFHPDVCIFALFGLAVLERLEHNFLKILNVFLMNILICAIHCVSLREPEERYLPIFHDK